MRSVLILAFIALSGCETEEGFIKVRFEDTPLDKLQDVCPEIIGTVLGCTYQPAGDVWVIYSPAPKNVADVKRLETIGHELYCHAWLKDTHRDAQGHLKDPSKDCLPKK